MDTVTVLIPHIPVRSNELTYTIKSVMFQTHCPNSIHVEFDDDRTGSAATRNRGLRAITTDWVAFLDDDDELLPHHLETLLKYATTTGADVVYTGCHVIHPELGDVPLIDEWGRFGRVFDADILRQQSYIPVTSLVRTEFAQRAMFGPPAHQPNSDYDDWGFYLRMLDDGATFLHVPIKTWIWNHNGKNTSGRPDRW